MRSFFRFIANFTTQNLLLLLILLLGFLLRSNDLGGNPFGFFCDEASIGYNAYTIWEKGIDEFGRPWPLFFQSFGDYKNPFFIYFLSPIVGIFGISESSVRMGSILLGLMGIISTYLLASELWGRKIGLLSSLLLTVSPWHIHFSRIGFELISSVALTPLFLLFFKKSVNNPSYYPLSILFFGLTFFSYTTPKIYLGPLLLFSFLSSINEIKPLLKSSIFWKTNLIFLLITVALLYQPVKSGIFFSRWDQIAPKNYGFTQIINGYLNHFSLDFLFKVGDIGFKNQFITRHSVKGMGQLFWFQLPLILAFFHKLLHKKYRQKHDIFLALFLLIYPLGSIFIQTNPQATRSVIGVIPFQIASSLGLIHLINLSKKVNFKTPLVILFLLSAGIEITRMQSLLKQYPLYSSDYWGWQYGAAPIMQYFLEQKDNYDLLCLEGSFNSGEIFLKFYDPKNLCNGKCQLCGYPSKSDKQRQLFAISKSSYDKLNGQVPKSQLKRTIYYPDGRPAFYLLENIIK